MTLWRRREDDDSTKLHYGDALPLADSRFKEHCRSDEIVIFGQCADKGGRLPEQNVRCVQCACNHIVFCKDLSNSFLGQLHAASVVQI